MRAQARLLLGEPTEAVEDAERAAELAVELEDPDLADQVSRILDQARNPGIELSLAKAAAAIEAGRASDAVAILRPLLVRGAPTRVDEAWVHGLLAKAHLGCEEDSLAAVHAERALAIAEEAGDPDAIRAFRALLGRAEGDRN